MCSSNPRGLVLTPDETLSWDFVRRALDGYLGCVVDEISHRTRIDRSLLLRKLLLHLPRFSFNELCDRRVVLREAWKLGESVASLQAEYQGWLSRRVVQDLDSSRLSLRICSLEVARAVHERFHYIGHFHEGTVHLGLFSLEQREEVPLALASLSVMDVPFLERNFPAGEERGQVLQISRVYAFDCAPKNTISFLFGRVVRWIKQNLPEISMLLSYVNPNLGFSGSSYFASNWARFSERAPIYSYLHGNYIPYRVFLSLSQETKKTVTYAQYRMENLRLLSYAWFVPKGKFGGRHSGAQECRATP